MMTVAVSQWACQALTRLLMHDGPLFPDVEGGAAWIVRS